MNMLKQIEAVNTPWKIINRISSWITFFPARIMFSFNGIAWGRNWRLYGIPGIQKHRQSMMQFGSNLQLRSTMHSNPLGANHPVLLSTLNPGAVIEIGDNFAMTGGSICAAQRITIGKNVVVGANCIIIDTDFHPLDPELRRQHPQDANSSPVFIEDNVFIGMNCIILKGVRIGHDCVIGAGSVVTKDLPSCIIVAGNPARMIGKVHV